MAGARTFSIALPVGMLNPDLPPGLRLHPERDGGHHPGIEREVVHGHELAEWGSPDTARASRSAALDSASRISPPVQATRNCTASPSR